MQELKYAAINHRLLSIVLSTPLLSAYGFSCFSPQWLLNKKLLLSSLETEVSMHDYMYV
jgi:hypothetical protein